MTSDHRRSERTVDDGIGFKARGKAKYTIVYTDENGRRRKKTGVTDKAVTERIAHDIENQGCLETARTDRPEGRSVCTP